MSTKLFRKWRSNFEDENRCQPTLSEAYAQGYSDGEHEAAPVPPVRAPLSEVAWLVESTLAPMWWDGRFLSRGIDPRHFTTDPNAAVRFSRKEDAERIASQSSFTKATEHMWCEAAHGINAQPVLEPLSDEAIDAIWEKHNTSVRGWEYSGDVMEMRHFECAARAIEAAIKEQK